MLAQWRATYAPGDWIVLAGPTSLVVMQPLAVEWSELVEALWQEVLACSSMVELADRLVAFGIADMPSFGAFFWTADGMRSLVRGGVRVRDAATGDLVADGQGVQTWSEVGLSGLERVRIEVPQADTGRMELPLVVGAVYASALTLDASASALVASPQASGPGAEQPDDRADIQPGPAAQPSPDGGSHLDDDGSPDDGSDDDSYPDAVRTLMENASTELMPIPVVVEPTEPDQEARPEDAAPAALAVLALSDGQRLDLLGTVRIGRAPSPEPGGDPGTELVTVPSPQQDISRTHLQIHPQAGQIVVTDLHSTNGTMLVLPGTELYAQRLPSGEAVAVPLGSVLDLGDGLSVSIERPH